VCPSGVSSEQVAAAVRIEVSHAIALVLGERGSSLAGHDLEALREGRRTEVDEADLVRLANVCGLPAWTLTTAPPEGHRLVLIKRSDGWHAAHLPDGGPVAVDEFCVDRRALTACRSLPPLPDEPEPAAPPAPPPRNRTAGAGRLETDAGRDRSDQRLEVAATRRRWWRFGR
jgi:hypothetical protein